MRVQSNHLRGWMQLSRIGSMTLVKGGAKNVNVDTYRHSHAERCSRRNCECTGER